MTRIEQIFTDVFATLTFLIQKPYVREQCPKVVKKYKGTRMTLIERIFTDVLDAITFLT